MKLVKRMGLIASSTIMTVSSLLGVGFSSTVNAISPPSFTCTWTAAGIDKNFSTAANWSGCNSAAPQAGDNDNLVFDTGVATTGSIHGLINDIANLSVNNIIISGSIGDEYAMTGNAITVVGNITNTSISNFQYTSLGMPLIMNGQHTITTTEFSYYADIQGSGAITVDGGSIELGNLSNYSGTMTSNNAVIELAKKDRSTFKSAGTIAVNGAAAVTLVNTGVFSTEDASFDLNLSLGGSGVTKIGALNLEDGIGGTSFTLKGSTVLTSDIYVTAFTQPANLHIRGPLSNNHVITSIGNNTVTIDNQSTSANDSQPTQQVTVGSHQVYIIDGVRGDTAVTSGGTLKGTGTVANLNVFGGGILAPGHSPGCMTVSGDLHQGGTYQAELGGTVPCSGYDQMIVTGNVVLNDGGSPAVQGILELSFYNGFVPTVGQTFQIVNNQGSQPVSGTFVGLPEGSSISFNGHNFKISYKGGDGNDIVLTAVTAVTAPSTGFGVTSSHALATFAGFTTLAGGVYLLARRLSRTNANQR